MRRMDGEEAASETSKLFGRHFLFMHMQVLTPEWQARARHFVESL